jgi:hypothetical protein
MQIRVIENNNNNKSILIYLHANVTINKPIIKIAPAKKKQKNTEIASKLHLINNHNDKLIITITKK